MLYEGYLDALRKRREAEQASINPIAQGLTGALRGGLGDYGADPAALAEARRRAAERIMARYTLPRNIGYGVDTQNLIGGLQEKFRGMEYDSNQNRLSQGNLAALAAKQRRQSALLAAISAGVGGLAYKYGPQMTGQTEPYWDKQGKFGQRSTMLPYERLMMSQIMANPFLFNE